MGKPAHAEPTEFVQKRNHSLKNLTRHAEHAEHDHAEHEHAEHEHDDEEADDEEAEDMPAHAGVPLEHREKPVRRISKPKTFTKVGVPLEQREKQVRRIAKPEVFEKDTEFAQKASKSFLRRH